MTSPLNQITKRLDEIDEARNKATPNQWSCYDANEGEPRPLWSVSTDNYHNQTNEEEQFLNLTIDYGLKSDAEFIALAANEIKSLTAALRAACFALEYYQGKLYHADKALEQIAEKLKG